MSATLFIMAITVMTSFIAFGNQGLFNMLKFNAFNIHHHRQVYRFLSHGLLHVDYMHLGVNMLVLFSFGRSVENHFLLYFGETGRLFFILLYVAGLSLSVVPAYFKHRKHSWYNAAGASGAVSAVLFASIIIYPERSIIILLFPIPVPAFVFGLFYLAYSAYMAKKGRDHVGHDVHFWGAIVGFLFPALLDPAIFIRFVSYVF